MQFIANKTIIFITANSIRICFIKLANCAAA